MSSKKDTGNGGINISGENVSIKGDVIGRDKVVTNYDNSSKNWVLLEKEFSTVKERISREVDDEVYKEEIQDKVTKIEEEVKKGEDADSNKVEKWLKFIAGMSDDIYQVVVSTLANPVLGISKTIQLIAQKAKE